jgi:type I protein arginine methyltransferase
MLGDYVRTGTYQRAMYSNSVDFAGKVVLDVGTGTGILAFFALQAGAAKVYAVDASNSVAVARKLAEANGYGDKVIVVKGKIEEITLPEKVDIIVSEPIGFLLVHERMLESYVVARERFLKPNGLMFPTTGSIVLSPFSDDAVYKEQMDKVAFWNVQDFYGVDISPMVEQAEKEYFSQPIVGYVPAATLISRHRTIHTIDFSAVDNEDLQHFEIPFSFHIDKTG